jgi:hypothetical protein
MKKNKEVGIINKTLEEDIEIHKMYGFTPKFVFNNSSG